MSKLLEILAGVFGGGAGQAVGKAATLAGIVAALAPLAIWMTSNKDQVFVTVTYGELAFWGAIFAAQLFVAWRVRPGG